MAEDETPQDSETPETRQRAAQHKRLLRFQRGQRLVVPLDAEHLELQDEMNSPEFQEGLRAQREEHEAAQAEGAERARQREANEPERQRLRAEQEKIEHQLQQWERQHPNEPYPQDLYNEWRRITQQLRDQN